MTHIRRLPPWLIAIFAVAASLSLISVLPARAGTEFTAGTGTAGSFQAAPAFQVTPRYPAAVIASGPARGRWSAPRFRCSRCSAPSWSAP